ncbi:NADPH oxidase 5-like [Anneissia japonica]|uniref:NADPH oxidase 5-like n=1 Tax=Anneissia japonica TaxID=1529436 RepID=UPI001425B805|nr:NADPH oxidase 5-like [Anneissia japonica]
MFSAHVQEYCLATTLYSRQVDLSEFCSAVPFEENFARNLFNFFDQNGEGLIRLSSVIQQLGEFEMLPPIEKLRYIFHVIDTEGTGLVNMETLLKHLGLWVDVQSSGLTSQQVHSVASAVFTTHGNADVVSIEEVIKTIEDNKALMAVMTSVHQNQVLANEQQSKGHPHRSSRTPFPFKLPRRFCSVKYIAYNKRKIVVFLFIIFVNMFMSGYGAWKYREHNWCVIIARGCGASLNVAVVMVVMFMLRYWATRMRRTRMAKLLPLDNFLMFHKMLGVIVACYSLVHTVAHVGNAILMTQLSTNGLSLWDVLFTFKAGVGYVKHSAYITGWVLISCLLVLILGSTNYVRQLHFQIFFMSHLLYLPFIITLLLHGPNFWKYLVIPGGLFVVEKTWSSDLLKRLRYGRTYIEEVHLLPNGVAHLKMTRHRNFKFNPGDYVFLHIPVLQKYEWHPFTISSAPDDTETLSCHIRSLGDWTKNLYKFFETHTGQQRVDSYIVDNNNASTPSKKSTQTTGSTVTRVRRRSASFRANRQVYIDGPYATQSCRVFETDHAVLVATGIGVTPFASILYSILHRYRNSKLTCPSCHHSWIEDGAVRSLNRLKKVDFVWINRDPKSFEWFVSLLAQLENQQEETIFSEFLTIHLYMTSKSRKEDSRDVALQMALDRMCHQTTSDVITGLKTRTRIGRPNWSELMSSIQKRRAGKVKVFFCGPTILANIIKSQAQKHGFLFCKEIF